MSSLITETNLLLLIVNIKIKGHPMFTYRDLQKWISSLDSDQLECNVSIYSSEDDEYYPMKDADTTVLSDVLDENHPILIY